MAIKEHLTLLNHKGIDIKKLINPGKKVIVYNPQKEILFESEDNFTGKVSTPKENTIAYGTPLEVTAEISKLNLKPITKTL